jgi:cell division initiation protein
MLTPLDIHNKEFTKSMRGYKPEEVDSFLDEIIKDFETLFRENHEMKEQMQKNQEESVSLKEKERSIQEAVMMVQKLVDEEKRHAEKECEILLWEAKKQGERLLEEARAKVAKTEESIEQLKLYEKQLYSKFKGFLEFQMELLNGYSSSKEDSFMAQTVTKPESVLIAHSNGDLSSPTVVTAVASATTSAEKKALLSDSVRPVIGGDDDDDDDDDDDEDHDSASLEQVLQAAERVEAVLKSLDSAPSPRKEEGEIVHGPWRK